MLDALGVTSSVIVPLVARARTVGALAFGTTSTSRRLMKEDLELAEELARRAAIARVFDRFWQSSTRTHGGSGLGLTIAKGIVEAHGGHIWLESAPGAGTTFFFTLPSVPSSITTERRQKAARA